MNPIEQNAIKILKHLVENNLQQAYKDDIAKALGISSIDAYDAMSYLEDIGAISHHKFLEGKSIGMLTSRGKFIYHDMMEKEKQASAAANSTEQATSAQLPERPINPVGSPYGFEDEDWEYVAVHQKEKEKLSIVLGLQFESKFYNTSELEENFKNHFLKALSSFNQSEKKSSAALEFKKLQAGYGEHLFNKIARDILAADITVFEASDLNPNVMIELGVALTWGKRVLPIREKTSQMLPSDISGQTWLSYEDSGKKILDQGFEEKLVEMIRRAMMKKWAKQ